MEDLLTSEEENTPGAVQGVEEVVAAEDALHLGDQVKSHRSYSGTSEPGTVGVHWY